MRVRAFTHNGTYFVTGVECSECVEGKYKVNTGNAACALCPNATYSKSAAAIDSKTCLACMTDATSHEVRTFFFWVITQFIVIIRTFVYMGCTFVCVYVCVLILKAFISGKSSLEPLLEGLLAQIQIDLS